MKKTVVFDFPDDFEFPPEFTEKICCKSEGWRTPDVVCPFYISNDDYYPYCMLTGGGEEEGKTCPFYGGVDIVNYDDCQINESRISEKAVSDALKKAVLVLQKGERVELIPLKNDIKVVGKKREEVKEHGKN